MVKSIKNGSKCARILSTYVAWMPKNIYRSVVFTIHCIQDSCPRYFLYLFSISLVSLQCIPYFTLHLCDIVLFSVSYPEILNVSNTFSFTNPVLMPAHTFLFCMGRQCTILNVLRCCDDATMILRCHDPMGSNRISLCILTYCRVS